MSDRLANAAVPGLGGDVAFNASETERSQSAQTNPGVFGTRQLAVEVDRIAHRYDNRIALNNLSFTVEAGSIFALLGPNGGGKTTLFKILATMLTPTIGTARVCGDDVVAQRSSVRRRLGINFQHPSLDGKLTVRENMVHQGHLYGLRGPPLSRRVHELLDYFELTDRRDDRIEKLSGGLQRRVEVAKSLIHRPPVLLLDEPSTGLDPAARISLMSLLYDLRERDGVTCLLTTHLMDEADRCDRIAFLDEGRLVACDTPSSLKSQVGCDVVRMTARDPATLAKNLNERFGYNAEVRGGVVRVERERGGEFVPELIAAFPGEIESVTVSKPTLDDVFLRLTGHSISGDDGGSGQ